MEDADIQLHALPEGPPRPERLTQSRSRAPQRVRDLAESVRLSCDNLAVFWNDGFLREAENGYVSALYYLGSTSFLRRTRAPRS